MTDTGEIIRLCRYKYGWSRRRLAERSGVPYNTIVTVERRGDCRVSTFERLLDAMGYEMEVFRKEKL